MPTNPAPRRTLPERAAQAVAALAFSTACLWPYLDRLASPSLYADDIVRVSQLQAGALGAILFVPFNEHVAPLFQGVSWLTWQAAGRRLARAPLAFTVASFVPFVPVLGLVGWVVRRETGSRTTALACLAVFCLSWLSVETVYWYSASSFLWSLLATLVAWAASASGEGGGRRRWRYRVVAAVAAAAAPAFSAVGLLAGPVAAVRALATSGGRRLGALAPLSGTLFALLVYGTLHDRAALASNVGRSAGVWPGVLAAARAPAASIVPALFGLPTWRADSGTVAGLQAALTVALFFGLLLRAYRGHDRPLLLGGMALIAGGYLLTFCARAGEPGRSLLETQRYHLFPMLGFVMLLAPALKAALSRWDARPAGGVWVATALAAVLLALHGPEMKGRARFLRYPDQARTLAAVDRLGGLCARLKVTRAQALAALDPIETAWTPSGYNALIVLGPCAPAPGISDPLVRPTLLSSLTADERRSLCGGMDATPYLQPAGPSESVGRRVALFRVREVGEARYVSEGWPSFIEYELPAANPGDALGFVGNGAGGPVEVWWRGSRQRWSETRSVRLRPPGDSSRPWLLPPERLPHWDASEARRVRVLYRAPGPVAVSAPRLVR